MTTKNELKKKPNNMAEDKRQFDFNGLRLALASPDQIHDWSHGEVTKPETINYRTQKPEKDGLFDERIFGPSKDWECYCGKYKKIRYKGIVCDKCGVEVTRSVVRRERMGHINLAAPSTHIWFLRGVPSRIGLILDLSLQSLEKVVYFANFIITKVDEDLKKDTLEQIRQEYKSKVSRIEKDAANQVNQVKVKANDKDKDKDNVKLDSQIAKLNQAKDNQIAELEKILRLAESELKELRPMTVISEHQYQDLSLKYGHIFEAGIGAEAIRDLLAEIDLSKLITELQAKIENSRGAQREKLIKRLRLVKNFDKNKIRPEWMVMTVIPVIPPDLRPMVPLDGGRFATSDLNDLYRRIINRNNRLKQLHELNAPEVIIRNEKRMLQEAVDALIDNSARHGKTVVASTGQKRMLKSLADVLKGKQGRFRQNLLGKRIDYSGRSVIVVGPNLRLDQCGLPKMMALELFRPFIISRLIQSEIVHNVRSANRYIDAGNPEVMDILEDIIEDATVLLNRAPTLHRLGIQAFKPVLIEGKAIQVHPLVCPAFNADFDGDQMAVHVPLTPASKWEANNLMLSSKNLLKPATGDPIVMPSQDMVWGAYYMTLVNEKKEPKAFSSFNEAHTAYQLRRISIQDEIILPLTDTGRKSVIGTEAQGDLIKTTVGRLLFNQILPRDLAYYNKTVEKGTLKEIVGLTFERGEEALEENIRFIDALKKMTFHYLTRSGYSWSMDDLPFIEAKQKLIAAGDKAVAEIEDQYATGLLTDSERHAKIIEIWMDAKDQIVKSSRDTLDRNGPVYSMVESGARGSWSQLIQIMGMKGLVTNPSGGIIELPVKGNFKEGFDVLEYFISTHGARKGLSDTALRTANAGYLTRRLVDVAQDLVISSNDCGDTTGEVVNLEQQPRSGWDVYEKVKGRALLADVPALKSKKVLVKKGELITREVVELLKANKVSEVHVRSVLECKLKKGICQQCYGLDLGHNRLVDLGTAVGVVAAQSIGEPGTQLTMRTFHTGGVAGLDITQGLPRVEEVFEARTPKVKAILSEVDGKVKIEKPNGEGKNSSRSKIVKIAYEELEEDVYAFPKGKDKPNLAVKDTESIKKASLLFTTPKREKVVAKRDGIVKVEKDKITVTVKTEKFKEYVIPPEFSLLVEEGDLVAKGQELTNGSFDLQQIYKLRGKEEAQNYIVKEILNIYHSQGQKLNDKHVELICRKMFSRILVKDPGDSEFVVGERIERGEFLEVNEALKKKNKKEATGDLLLLGITKVSLSTTSFLSAASFQETQRVLINAAVEGKIDRLEGLKENVIIARLIPAGTGYPGNEVNIPEPEPVSLDEDEPVEEAKNDTEDKMAKAKELLYEK